MRISVLTTIALVMIATAAPALGAPSRRELERRRVAQRGKSDRSAHMGQAMRHGVRGRDDALVARKVNWKGLKHDVPKAIHAGMRVWHDIKGKRGDDDLD